jgi:hypothetical protein
LLPSSELDAAATRKAWAIILLYSRPYWERVWIVQEVAFARDLEVYCGPDMIRWTEMKLVILAMRDEYTFILTACTDKDVAPHMMTLVVGGPYNVMNCFGEIEYEENAQQEASLGYLLVLHRYRMSSDPRDKIFSLLGLTSPEMQKGLPINYGVSVARLLIDTITCIIQGEKDLTVMTENKRPHEFYQNPNMTYSLPSWVPRFDYKKGDHLGRISQFRLAWSGAGGSTSLIADICDRVLKLRGIAVCRVTAIGSVMPENITEGDDFTLMFDILYEWWNIY